MRRHVQDLIDQDLKQARDLLAELCREFPDEFEYQLAYAQTQRHVMLHCMATHRMDESKAAFDQARKTLTDLLAHYPREPRVMLELADTLSASARLKQGDARQSEDSLRQAISISGQLCEAFPSVPEYQALLANSQDKLGVIEFERNNLVAADRSFLQATERLSDLLNRFPDHRFYQLSTLLAATHLAEVRLKNSSEGDKSLSVAGDFLEKAIEAYRNPGPIDPFTRGKLNRAYDTLIAIYETQGDAPAADDARKKRQSLGGPMRR